MAIDRALLDKARLRPHALRFEEALQLSRQLGFEKVRQVRRHRILRHPGAVALNLQAGADGYAKAYQVRRMLEVSRA